MLNQLCLLYRYACIARLKLKYYAQSGEYVELINGRKYFLDIRLG
jgi:hypothetical protein